MNLRELMAQRAVEGLRSVLLGKMDGAMVSRQAVVDGVSRGHRFVSETDR